MVPEEQHVDTDHDGDERSHVEHDGHSATHVRQPTSPRSEDPVDATHLGAWCGGRSGRPGDGALSVHVVFPGRFDPDAADAEGNVRGVAHARDALFERRRSELGSWHLDGDRARVVTVSPWGISHLLESGERQHHGGPVSWPDRSDHRLVGDTNRDVGDTNRLVGDTNRDVGDVS